MNRGEQLYIGVDGGGTKTVVALYDIMGNCLKETRCGPVNYNFIGVETAVENLLTGISGLPAWQEKTVAIGIGDPSIDDRVRSEESVRFRDLIRARLQIPVYVRSDAYMTLYALTRGETAGVLMISGTGAMGICEDAVGRISFAGGWGRLTGDEGSGYYIGLSGIRAALHAADGIAGGSEMLLRAALSYFGVQEPRALIDLFYGEKEPNIAGFCTSVCACADAGDGISIEILHGAAAYLAQYASVLLKRSGAKLLGTYGSVLQCIPTVSDAFCHRIRERFPDVKIETPTLSAECAAALYAKKCFLGGLTE